VISVVYFGKMKTVIFCLYAGERSEMCRHMRMEDCGDYERSTPSEYISIQTLFDNASTNDKVSLS
jgi:hypothetical protein